ncbi:hypothetical protein AALP_AA6G116400 [Arabis alpina]|uniref:GBF-interacting protein 1 N-terminal domain-containing protein n=1 Tax=Arabis alpina TaxID=50452 RepID=A0A087GNL8_ARAAL|nr:hypothetical protein AALP_AA6G116400 [Arabis alpina]
MVRKSRKKGGRNQDGNVNADVIPAESRTIVERIKEIIYFSEQEIYQVLVECRMNPHETIQRLLYQVSFQEVKSRGDKEKEISQTQNASGSCSQDVDDSSIQNGECSNAGECGGNELNSDETSNVEGTCNHLADSSTTSGILGPYKSDLTNDETEIVRISSDEADPPISLPSSSDLTNEETKIVPIGSAEAVPSIYVSSSSDLTDGETKIVPISSAEAVPSISVPSSSDLTNGETKIVPISSAEAIPLISVPSSRYQSAWNRGTSGQRSSSRKVVRSSPRRPARLISADSGQRTMAEVLKMSLGLSKESITKAPPLHEKSDVPNPFSNSLNECAATRDQLQESASVSNQNLRDDDVSNPFSNSLIDSAAGSDQTQESASVSNQSLCDDDVSNPFSNSIIDSPARSGQIQEPASVSNQKLLDNYRLYFSKPFIEPAARQDQLPESASVSNQNLRNDDVTYPFSNSVTESFELNRTIDLPASVGTSLQQLFIEIDEPSHQQVKTSELQHMTISSIGSGMNDDSEDFADDWSLKGLISSDDEPYEEEEEQQRMWNVANELLREQAQYETHETAQKHQSSATDLTFDNSQRLNPASAPSERSLQMENFNTFPDVMHQQADLREPVSPFPAYPFNQPMPINHSIATASSLGRTPSVSMTGNHQYSQPEVPSVTYGNMMNHPYLPNQDDVFNFSPSAFQQHGSSNSSTYPHHKSLASMLPQYRNNNLPQLVVPTVPTSYGSAYGPSYGSASALNSAFGSANGGFGTLSDNAANSEIDYSGLFSSRENIWSPERQSDSPEQWERKYHRYISG